MRNCLIASALTSLAVGCGETEAHRIERARAQVERIAEDLDRRTTETGAYVRVNPANVNQRDPWGTRIEVFYSDEGVAETIVVRSAGPDRASHTGDDIEATTMSANLKGIGEGIKQNVEETAASAAKGAVKGTIEGLKESLPFGRKEQKDPPAEAEPAE